VRVHTFLTKHFYHVSHLRSRRCEFSSSSRLLHLRRHARPYRSGDHGQARRSARPEGKRHRRPLIPGGAGLEFHRAKKEKDTWEVEERAALLQQEKANMASELQAMEDSTAAATHQGDDA
jgi:hypothetical protein